MRIAANSTWFDFSISGGPPFAVYAFSGTEAVRGPFEFAIELVSKSANEDLIGLAYSIARIVLDTPGEK